MMVLIHRAARGPEEVLGVWSIPPEGSPNEPDSFYLKANQADYQEAVNTMDLKGTARSWFSWMTDLPNRMPYKAIWETREVKQTEDLREVYRTLVREALSADR